MLIVNAAGVITWTNSSGDRNWFNPLNWSPAVVPNGNSVVQVSGVLTVPSNAAFAVLNITGGTVEGTFAVSGTLTWTGGELRAQVTVAPGAVLNIAGDQPKSAPPGMEITNHGTVTWSGTGNITGAGYFPGGPAYIRNHASGVFNVTNDASVVTTCPGGCSGTQLIWTNAGLLTKTGGTGMTSLNFGGVTNTGVVRVATGTLRIPSFNNDGRAEVSAAAQLIVTHGTSTGTFFTAGTGRLDIGGTNTLTGSTFEGPGEVHLTGRLIGQVGGSTLVLDSFGPLEGTFTLAGTLTWRTGELRAQMTVASGAALNIAGDQPKSAPPGMEIINHGTVTWSGTGNITGAGYFPGGPAYIRNQASGVFNITNDASVVTSCPGGCSGTQLIWTNAGLITKTGDVGMTNLGAGGVTNTGLVRVTTGTLGIANFNNDGRTEVTAAARLIVQNGMSTGTFFTAGTGRLDIGGTSTLTGSTFEGPGEVHLTGTLFGQVGGSTLVLDSFGPLEGTFALTGTLTWRTGELRAQLTVAPGAALNIAGDQPKSAPPGMEIINHGTVTWSGTGNITGAGYFPGGPAYIRNQASGVFNITNDASVVTSCPGGCSGTQLIWTNAGLITKTGDVGMTNLGAGGITNTGRVETHGGSLVVGPFEQAAGDTRLVGGSLGGSTLTFLGGTLSGSGVINADVVNAAVVRPGGSPGTLTINGNYTQTAEGVIEVELASLIQGTGHDRLVVTGEASLAGTLNAALFGGFLPSFSNAFPVLMYGSRSGAFDSVSATFPAPLSVSQAFGPSAMTLTINVAGNSVKNGFFTNGMADWQQFATPDMSYIVSNVNNGVLEFSRVPPPPGTSNQAVVFQETGMTTAAESPLEARFDLGNSSSVRKRISVLLLDSNFSDLSVCTFWLPANAPLRTYYMRTHTTQAWSNAAIYFYAATPGSDGGAYLLDNVALRVDPSTATDRTDCVDPNAPVPTGVPDGPELLLNGDFGSATLGPWGVFGQIVSQVAAGVFEFYRPPGTPAGVVLQLTGAGIPANEVLTATFDLGNSSGVRKRVTILIHDSDFTDLSACTFWLAPGQPLSSYTMRSFTTEEWGNATISIYGATIGSEQWIRLDNVSMRRSPSSTTSGSDCIEPGSSTSVSPGFTGFNSASTGRRTSVDAHEWRASGGFSPLPETVAAESRSGWVVESAENGPELLLWNTPLDLRDATEARLIFKSWLTSQRSKASVQVSDDGVTWRTVADVLASDGWTTIDVDLGGPRWTGDVGQVRVRSGGSCVVRRGARSLVN